MRKLLGIVLLGSILFVSGFAAFAQDPDSTPPDTEVVVDQPVETAVPDVPLPGWVSILIAIVGYLGGMWTNKKVFAEKATAAKDKALQKVAEADSLFGSVSDVLSSGNLTPEKIQNIVRQWKVIRNKSED